MLPPASQAPQAQRAFQRNTHTTFGLCGSRRSIEFLISMRAFLPAGISARNKGVVIATMIPQATNPIKGFGIWTNLRKTMQASSENIDAPVNGANSL
jgi:hypothetical protein